ncbi:hypothetical protein GCM10027425_27840 [Alteromonas gracilis]
MKIAGALATLAGVVTFLLLALLPTSVTVLGFSATCGPPVFRIFDTTSAASSSNPEAEQALTDQCVGQSQMRIFAGGIAGGVMALGGLFMFAVPERRSQPRVMDEGVGLQFHSPPMPSASQPTTRPRTSEPPPPLRTGLGEDTGPLH